MATVSKDNRPLTAHRFYIEIDGIKQAVFTEASSLVMEVAVLEDHYGGERWPRRMPGKAKMSNITLKRGITQGNELYKWILQLAQGEVKYKNISVVMFDTTGKELSRWSVLDAFPVKWTGPALQADSQQMAIETLEIAHNGIVPV
jgi:phage tail-like protein